MLEVRGELHGTTSAGLRTSQDLGECWKRGGLQGETSALKRPAVQSELDVQVQAGGARRAARHHLSKPPD